MTVLLARTLGLGITALVIGAKALSRTRAYRWWRLERTKRRERRSYTTCSWEDRQW